MPEQLQLSRWMCLSLIIGWLAGTPLWAQLNNNQNNQNQNFGGITIDGQGVVESSPPKRISAAALRKLQQAFADQNLSPELIQPSESRSLSLKQVDAAVKSLLDAGDEIPESLRYLAGMQRIDMLIIDRQQQDIFLVGPAEGFGPDANGRIVGLTTGRPPIQLDDLAVALRSRFAGQREIGVSIDPQNENLARMQDYIRRNSNAVSTAIARKRYQTMARILDQQVISLWGVPDDSHFALALTAADLKLKRIALGLEPSGVRGIRSHLSLLLPQGNSMQRWWFAPLYEPIGTNADRSVFEIRGQRVQVIAQEERVGPDGQRNDAAFTRQSTQRFAELFTDNYESLAQVNPTFAELQSLYDLSLIAALIDREWPFADRNTQLRVLLQDQRLPLESYPVPKFVPSTATSRMAGRGLLIGLIGGVSIDLAPVLEALDERATPNSTPFTQRPTPSDWWWNANSQRD